MGIASLVLGIIAFLFAFIPCINLMAVILALVGLVLGIIHLANLPKEGVADGKGQAIAGIVLSGLSILITIALLSFILTTGEKIGDVLANKIEEIRNQQPNIDIWEEENGDIHIIAPPENNTDTAEMIEDVIEEITD